MRPLVLFKRGDSLQVRLSFFFVVGAIIGTVFCNRMNVEMKLELVGLERAMMSTLLLEDVDYPGYFRSVVWKRSVQAAFVFLAASSGAFDVLSLLLAAFLGFAGGVLLCVLTMEAGAAGLVLFLLRLFPQIIFYTLFFYVLLWRLPGQRKNLNFFQAAALAGLVFLGAVAESFINPWFLAAGKNFFREIN